MRRDKDYSTMEMLLGRLRNNLRITSSDLDEDLLQKVDAASTWAERFLGQTIVPSVFDETYTIGTSSILSLRLHGPLLSAVTVEGDDAVIEKQNGEDITIKGTPGSVVRLTYKAGMEQIPADLTHAIIIRASYLFDNPSDTVEERNTASMNLLRSYRRLVR